MLNAREVATADHQGFAAGDGFGDGGARAEQRRRASGLPAVVMCFEPTPLEFFSPQSPPARLMRFAEKCQALEEYGIDIFCCLDFDTRMRSGSPDWFIQEVLVEILNVQHLIVGDQFQ